MRPRAWFRSICHPRARRRAAVTLGAIAVAIFLIQVFEVSSAFPDPSPTDPIASARCLTTGVCSKEVPATTALVGIELARQSFETLERSPARVEAAAATKASVCAASEGLAKIPQALRQHLLDLSRTAQAANCAQAVNVLAPLRAQLQDAYEHAKPTLLADHFVNAATDYVKTCFTRNMLLDRGALTPAEEKFMRAHIGFIVLRHNLKWEDSQPICHAARLGRFVVTAQHCIPPNSESYKAGTGYTPEIAFRFLDHPTNFGLVLRKLGTDKGYMEERSRDYAILEIPGAPNLEEAIAPLIGKMELFADFYNLTANIYLRVAGHVHSGAAFDFRRATRVEHSALCRPAYIGPDGLFLHACQTEAGISGAPLFQHQGGRLVFVGIHNGVTEALDDPTLAACAFGLPNYGVTVPPSVLTAMPLQ